MREHLPEDVVHAQRLAAAYITQSIEGSP